MQTKNELIQIIKKKDIEILIIFITFIISATLIFTLLYQIYPQKHKNVVIAFELDNETQIQNSQEIISQIKDNYLQFQKGILITNNISKYCKDCVGVNKNGYIVIEYVDSEYYQKENLCHEILHTFQYKPISEVFFGDETPNDLHLIIYDLENYLPCFEDKRLTIQLQRSNLPERKATA